MAGRGPAIHVFLVCVGQKTWVAGPRPAMTVGATHGSSSTSFGITPVIASRAATQQSPSSLCAHRPVADCCVAALLAMTASHGTNICPTPRVVRLLCPCDRAPARRSGQPSVSPRDRLSPSTRHETRPHVPPGCSGITPRICPATARSPPARPCGSPPPSVQSPSAYRAPARPAAAAHRRAPARCRPPRSVANTRGSTAIP